jgi:hypothetical protein
MLHTLRRVEAMLGISDPRPQNGTVPNDAIVQVQEMCDRNSWNCTGFNQTTGVITITALPNFSIRVMYTQDAPYGVRLQFGRLSQYATALDGDLNAVEELILQFITDVDAVVDNIQRRCAIRRWTYDAMACVTVRGYTFFLEYFFYTKRFRVRVGHREVHGTLDDVEHFIELIVAE